MRRFALAVVLLQVVAGCSSEENALFVLGVEVPQGPVANPQGGDYRYVYVQFAREEYAFMIGQGDAGTAVDWGNAQGISIAFESWRNWPDPPTVSALTRNPDGNLHVKIMACENMDCIGEDRNGAPQLWFDLEHPFYMGQRTFWNTPPLEVPVGVPDSPMFVSGCQIGGCFNGNAVAGYCCDGHHFCAGPCGRSDAGL